ncbi:hypothetical protein LCGC14_3097840, partial [marine sediment metagenome]
GQDVNILGIRVGEQANIADAEIRRYQSEIDFWAKIQQDAIDRGNLTLAQEAQMRQGELQQQMLEVQARQQDVTQRGDTIDAQLTQNQQNLDNANSLRDHAISIGNLELQTQAEERIRAFQQQDVTLRQHQQQISTAQTGIGAQQGSADVLAGIASSFGQIEQQRDQELARLAANPRDFLQLQYGLGQGESFLNQLLSGQPLGGQSTLQIGDTPTLGGGFERLVDQLTARPDIARFDEATEAARRLAEMGQNVPQAPDLASLTTIDPAPMKTRPNVPKNSAVRGRSFAPINTLPL